MSIKSFVNNKTEFDAFCSFIEENYLKVAYKQLKQDKDIHQIYRRQGEILALEKMLDLRNTVNGSTH